MAGGKKPSALSPAVQKLAALPILVTVATRRADGSVQLNPVWFELKDGFIWLNSNTSRTWPKNL
ncbi:MAG TPA: pyridoxamine 5'-phosphate oxidase family protein, partial [Candidatus Dormibacteraeota bacterium]